MDLVLFVNVFAQLEYELLEAESGLQPVIVTVNKYIKMNWSIDCLIDKSQWIELIDW